MSLERRVVPLTGGINFRDLGGYLTATGEQVRWGKLFRSGHLQALTDADLQWLHSLGISEVHDLRKRDEQQRVPSRNWGARSIADYDMNIGSLAGFWARLRAGELNDVVAHQLVVASYRESLEEVAPPYARLLRALVANAHSASLFHCAAGKDRTGLAAALLLAALGVSREDILQDYLLTLACFDDGPLLDKVEGHLREAGVSTWERSWIQPFCSVHPDNLLAFFAAVDERYGSVEAYLQRALGVNGAFRDQLRRAFLQD